MISENGNSNSISIYRNTSIASNVSFAAAINISTNQPYGMCIVDLDGDGKLDVAVANFSNSTLGIFKNNSTIGNISLASEVDYLSGTSPSSVSVTDFDGDGKPDIVLSNDNGNTISVFRNTSTPGSISFAAKIDFTTGSYPATTAIGDIDGDGKPDIVSCDQTSNTVSVFRNTSTGTGNIAFASRVYFFTGSGPRCVGIGDFDGDGKLDLAIGNTSGASVSVFRNTSSSGAISFSTRVDYSLASGSVPTNISITDLDGDGKADITVCNQTPNTVAVLRNLSTVGNISFNSYFNYTTGTNPYGVSVNDIDGDGKPDIISANSSANSISVLRNQIGEPIVTSFSPGSSLAGGSVLITGINFTGATSVSFGGVAATSVTVISSTTIIATVGNGATGLIAVSTPLGTGYSATPFTFTVPIPTITSFTPASGAIGTTVTITGTNFNTTAANNIVYFGAVKATVNAATATSLTVVVPLGESYKDITVTNN